ncbi:MAG: hypothetical protein ACTHK7_03300 [Aureliella sp.]
MPEPELLDFVPLWLLFAATIAVVLISIEDSRRSPAIIALVLSFSAIIALIADLDRPREGFMTVSPQPMLDLKRMIDSGHEPFSRPNI